MNNPAYGILMIAGIVISAMLWRRTDRSRNIPVLVFVGGLIGAVVGAKLAYLLAEWPFHIGLPGCWIDALVGRTLLGGILCGYAGVEWGKWQSGYTAPTGDSFALVAPVGIAVGRIGCFLNGCCLGRVCGRAWYAVADTQGLPRYPASLMDAAFQIIFVAIAWFAYRRQILRGQLFHVYMIAYGTFRFVHEFYRATPRIAGVFSPYQILALLIVIVGAWRFVARERRSRVPQFA